MSPAPRHPIHNELQLAAMQSFEALDSEGVATGPCLMLYLHVGALTPARAIAELRRIADDWEEKHNPDLWPFQRT